MSGYIFEENGDNRELRRLRLIEAAYTRYIEEFTVPPFEVLGKDLLDFPPEDSTSSIAAMS